MKEVGLQGFVLRLSHAMMLDGLPSRIPRENLQLENLFPEMTRESDFPDPFFAILLVCTSASFW